MSIRVRILMYFAGVLAFFVVTLLLVVRTLLLNSFDTLERQTMQRNLGQAANALKTEIDHLALTVGDWAYWDVTYQYARGEEVQGFSDDFNDDNIAALQMNLVAITDADGKIRFSKNYDPVARQAAPITEAEEAYLTSGPTVADFPISKLHDSVAGLVSMDHRLMIVASRAILPSSLIGVPAGVFTFGRYLNDKQVNSLAEGLQLSMRIYPYGQGNLPEDVAAALPELTEETTFFIKTLNTSQIAGYSLLNGLDGQPVAILRVETPRETLAQGQYTALTMARLLVMTIILLTVVVVFALDRTVLRRITRLSKQVSVIQSSADQSGRVTVELNDEITALSRDINGMLDRLSASEKQLKEQNAELAVAYEQAQEATRLKSQFLSTMSHELRTPLNSINGYAGIMMAGVSGKLDTEALRMIQRIYDSGEHLLTLVNDILDIAKIEAGRLEVVEEEYSIRSLVQTTYSQLSVLADQKDVRFETRVDDDVPDKLMGDYERILQIVINLLSNAFKFTDAGSVTLAVSKADDQLKIQVKDTGIGVPPHALHTIFEEFRQVDGTSKRAHGGTGLGLAIVSKLSQAMGGKVTVESTLNVGSTFTVTLPLKPVPDAQLSPA